MKRLLVLVIVVLVGIVISTTALADTGNPKYQVEDMFGRVYYTNRIDVNFGNIDFTATDGYHYRLSAFVVKKLR